MPGSWWRAWSCWTPPLCASLHTRRWGCAVARCLARALQFTTALQGLRTRDVPLHYLSTHPRSGQYLAMRVEGERYYRLVDRQGTFADYDQCLNVMRGLSPQGAFPPPPPAAAAAGVQQQQQGRRQQQQQRRGGRR